MKSLESLISDLGKADLDAKLDTHPANKAVGRSFTRLLLPNLHEDGVGQITPNQRGCGGFEITLVVKSAVNDITSQADFVGCLNTGGYRWGPELNLWHTALLVHPSYQHREVAQTLYRVHKIVNGERETEILPQNNPQLLSFFAHQGYVPVRRRNFNIGSDEPLGSEQQLALAKAIGRRNTIGHPKVVLDLEKIDFSETFLGALKAARV